MEYRAGWGSLIDARQVSAAAVGLAVLVAEGVGVGEVRGAVDVVGRGVGLDVLVAATFVAAAWCTADVAVGAGVNARAVGERVAATDAAGDDGLGVDAEGDGVDACWDAELVVGLLATWPTRPSSTTAAA